MKSPTDQNQDAPTKFEEPGAEGADFAPAKLIALRVGLSSKTIHRWAKDGRIDRFKINARLTLFDSRQVREFIRAQRA